MPDLSIDSLPHLYLGLASHVKLRSKLDWAIRKRTWQSTDGGATRYGDVSLHAYSRNTDVRRNQAITSVVVSEGDACMSSQDESVRYIGTGRLHYILKIGLETEPWGEHDLIGCLQYHFIAGI